MTSRGDRFSHPNGPDGEPVPLVEHLEDVATRVEQVIPRGATTPSGAETVEITRRAGLLHDFGKLTRSFQAKIGVLEAAVTGPDHHAPLGALATYHVLDRCDFAEDDALAGFLAVASHHGRPLDVPELPGKVTAAAGRGSAYREEAQRQVQDIDACVPELADDILREASQAETDWPTFRDDVLEGSIQASIGDHGSTSASRLTLSGTAGGDFEDLYETFLPIWSGLVLADKTTAAGVPRRGFQAEPPDETALEAHVAELQRRAQDAAPPVQEINDLREEARTSVARRAEELVESDRNVATITLPTGLGKTFTGLQAALRIRDHKERIGEEPGRIVYALPYTSIVDQVADEAQEVFGPNADGRAITVHHHLAETRHRIEQGPEDPDARARLETMLGETWRSGLVVTTFVQLFESLIGSSNSQAMKLPALHDAVVVLDEPQALPHSWWPLVRRLASILGTRFNADVLAMTATQPHLFAGPEVSAPELIPDPEGYFDQLDRAQFHLHGSARSRLERDPRPVPHAAAAEEVARTLAREESTLSICNTIDSARALGQALRDQTDTLPVQRLYRDSLPFDDAADEEVRALADRVEREARRTDSTPLLQLTTRVRPRDRRRLLALARELLDRDGVPLALVSTQLVEAGVDVSFDAVYRDLAPMDSVVQAAGRCNRSSQGDRGDVVVWWLEAPGNQEVTPAEAVYARYGDNLLAHTARAFRDVLEEAEDQPLAEPLVTRRAVEAYYDSLDTANPGDRSMVDDLDEGRFRALGERSLIDEKRAVEVVFARTEEDLDRCQRFRELVSERRYDEARSILTTLRDLQVSIPVYHDDSEEARQLSDIEPLHPDAELRLLDGTTHRYEAYIDEISGEVVVPDTTVEARFL